MLDLLLFRRDGCSGVAYKPHHVRRLWGHSSGVRLGLGGHLHWARHSVHLLPPASHVHAGEGQLPAWEKSVQLSIQYLGCNRLPREHVWPSAIKMLDLNLCFLLNFCFICMPNKSAKIQTCVTVMVCFFIAICSSNKP